MPGAQSPSQPSPPHPSQLPGRKGDLKQTNRGEKVLRELTSSDQYLFSLWDSGFLCTGQEKAKKLKRKRKRKGKGGWTCKLGKGTRAEQGPSETQEYQ